MKKKPFFPIILFLNFIVAHSQVIKDSLTNHVVSFVEMYSDKGDLIGLTDNKGEVTVALHDLINRSNTKKVTFVHHSFKNKELNVALLKKETVIFLNPFKSKNKLEEVVVSGIKKQYQYLKLKGYFRSIQINENRPHYFIDGIVEYYIATQSGKVKAKIWVNRSFENKTIKQLSATFNFLLAGIPKPDDLLKMNTIVAQYNVKEINNTNIEIGNRENSEIKGSIKKEDALFELQLAVISNQNPKIMKGLGMESILHNYNINSFYNTSNYSKIGLNNLVSFKEIRNYDIKRKQKDNYTKIESIHEFFVTEKEYADEINAKNLDRFYTFKTPSSYSENYWQSVENPIFQSMPLALESYIKESMEEIKK
jgi:hypothetical protein